MSMFIEKAVEVVNEIDALEKEFYEIIDGSDSLPQLISTAEKLTSSPRHCSRVLMRVLELDPENLDAMVDMALMSWLINEMGDAETMIERAERRSPNSIQVLQAKSLVEQDEGKRGEIMRRILTLDPDNQIVREYLSRDL